MITQKQLNTLNKILSACDRFETVIHTISVEELESIETKFPEHADGLNLYVIRSFTAVTELRRLVENTKNNTPPNQ